MLGVAQTRALTEGVNYDAVRKSIADLLEANDYDDGSRGPVLIRLAWHACGTYDKKSGTGGSNGATMRFKPESDHGANSGLAIARSILEKVKAQYPEVSYADLWTLAGCVAVEEMGGPHIKWYPGRSDAANGDSCPADGRLPDASKGPAHIREIFYKMGFDDQEIVALAGAHCFGRCHADRSGFEGPWTRAPTTFSNMFFKELLENKWTPRRSSTGQLQYQDPSGALMMLPADLALIEDPVFRKHVEAYAKDEKKFSRDFAKAFGKLMALGVPSKKGGGDDSKFPFLMAPPKP
jgi:cytochrome c peroxidase